MEKEEQEIVRAAVEEIPAVADVNKVTEREVRNLAAEKIGIDLSAKQRKISHREDMKMEDMGKEEQEIVTAAVEEIPAVADVNKVMEREVRNLAAEKTGIDLSAKQRKTSHREDMKTEDMEKEEQERVKVAVEEVLAVADINKVTAREVRNLAAEKTGIDLSANRQRKRFVTNAIRQALESQNYLPITKTSASSDAKAEDSKPSREEQTPRNNEVEKLRNRGASRDSSSRKMKKTEKREDIKKKEDVSDQEYEDDDEDARGGGRMPTHETRYERDHQGKYIICELSGKRKVVVDQWKGVTLISLREYYEKDGKELPTSKGISLTGEQLKLLANSTNDVDTAIATAISSM